MTRDREKKGSAPPPPQDEQPLAPGPFEELFLKPTRSLDLNGTSSAGGDVFAPSPPGVAPSSPEARERAIYSAFAPTSPAPPPFPQPAEPPPVATDTGAFKAPPSFEKLVEELVPPPREEEQEAPRPRRRTAILAWVAFAVVALVAGGALLFRDHLAARFLPRTAAEVPSAPQPTQEIIGTAAGVGAGEAAGERATAVPEVAVEGVGAPPEPTPAASLPPPTLPAASAVAAVTWRTTAGGTEVVVRSNGAIAAERVRINALSSPPRVLVRLSEVTVGRGGEVREVGSTEVVRVRLGYHGELSPPQLYVVLDLTSAAVTLADATVAGEEVRLLLRRSSAN